MKLGRCIVFLRAQVDRITSNSEGCLAEDCPFSSGHGDNHFRGISMNVQRFSVGWYWPSIHHHHRYWFQHVSVFLLIFMLAYVHPVHGRGKMSNSSHGSGVFWKPMSYLTSSTLAHSLSLGTLFSREKCHNQRNIEILMYNIYIGLHITYGNQSKGPCRKF